MAPPGANRGKRRERGRGADHPSTLDLGRAASWRRLGCVKGRGGREQESWAPLRDSGGESPVACSVAVSGARAQLGGSSGGVGGADAHREGAGPWVPCSGPPSLVPLVF